MLLYFWNELEEERVVFSDGAVEERKEPQEKIYYVNCFEKDSYKDKPELDELLEQDERFCCYPVENETGWICACAYLNRKENQSCPLTVLQLNFLGRYLHFEPWKQFDQLVILYKLQTGTKYRQQ